MFPSFLSDNDDYCISKKDLVVCIKKEKRTLPQHKSQSRKESKLFPLIESLFRYYTHIQCHLAIFNDYQNMIDFKQVKSSNCQGNE